MATPPLSTPGELLFQIREELLLTMFTLLEMKRKLTRFMQMPAHSQTCQGDAIEATLGRSYGGLLLALQLIDKLSKEGGKMGSEQANDGSDLMPPLEPIPIEELQAETSM